MLILNTSPKVCIRDSVNVAAILATRGLRVPTIVCEHTNPKFAKITGRGLPLLRRLTYPLADLVTLLGHDMVPAFRVMVPGIKPVSYTHLDVYKRQVLHGII